MTATEIIHQFSKQNLLAERYLLGELSGMDLEDFERHMWECQACFEEVKAGQELKQHLAAGVSAPALGWWERLRKVWARHVCGEDKMLIAAICCGAPLPPGTRPDWEVPIFFAGVAFGVMLMAVLQRYAKRREKNAAVPERRYNGRYPRDAERRP